MVPSCLPICLSLLPAYATQQNSLLPSFVSSKTGTCDPVLSRAGILFRYRHQGLAALPQRSSLRSGLYCPCPSALIDLIRDTHEHSPIFPAFASYTGSLCCAGAPRLPTSGSELSLLILCQHAALCNHEEPAGSLYPVPFTGGTPSSTEERFGVLIYPTTVRYRWDRLFAANGSLLSLQPADLLAPLTDPTLLTLCRLGLLLRSFRQERSLSPPSGMTTVATGQVLLARFFPCWISS